MIRPVVWGGGGRTYLKHLSVIHKGQKRYPRRGTKDHEGPLRGWRRLKRVPPKVGKGELISTKGVKYLLRGQKINPRRDSKGLEKTRKGSVKGHEERH